MLEQEMTPLTITEFTRQVKDLVEVNFDQACVVGEVSNMTRAGSGHVYLTLKDNDAQLRAVMWRSRAERLKFDLQDGLEVVATGPLEVYQARGTYQLMVERMFPQGIGSLELAFRQMREKLAGEGLFNIERKRPLPTMPRRIALVTSPTGAAVRDILQVMSRRWSRLNIIVVPVPVQGNDAAPKIAEGIRVAGQLPDVDVIITGRGGGSLEDLWCFNEEAVARAIFDSPVPVVSAVGHEIDVTIADLVADRRALTPSEAAELVVPSRTELKHTLEQLRSRLGSGLQERAARARMNLESLASRRVFTHPLDRVHEMARRVDDLDATLQRTITQHIQLGRQQLSTISASIDALSPLKVLGRGYTITSQSPAPESPGSTSGEVISSAANCEIGQDIVTQFADGRVTSRIANVERNQIQDQE